MCIASLRAAAAKLFPGAATKQAKGNPNPNPDPNPNPNPNPNPDPNPNPNPNPNPEPNPYQAKGMLHVSLLRLLSLPTGQHGAASAAARAAQAVCERWSAQVTLTPPLTRTRTRPVA